MDTDLLMMKRSSAWCIHGFSTTENIIQMVSGSLWTKVTNV